MYGHAATAQMLQDRLFQRYTRMVTRDGHRADLARRSQRLHVHVRAVANDRDAPFLEGIASERRDVAAGNQDDGASVLKHTGIGLGNHLEASHRAACYVTLAFNAPTSCNAPTAAMRVLISSEDIQLRVREMAADIRRDHPDGVHLIAVLKGAFVFLSDLARAIPGRCTIDFTAVSSYGTLSSSSGQVQLLKDLDSGSKDATL